MTKLLVLAVLLAGAGYAIPALAGDCGGGACGGGASASADGFSCSNPCPLAQQANARRSRGCESFAMCASTRGAFAAAVQRNLARM